MAANIGSFGSKNYSQILGSMKSENEKRAVNRSSRASSRRRAQKANMMIISKEDFSMPKINENKDSKGRFQSLSIVD